VSGTSEQKKPSISRLICFREPGVLLNTIHLGTSPARIQYPSNTSPVLDQITFSSFVCPFRTRLASGGVGIGVDARLAGPRAGLGGLLVVVAGAGELLANGLDARGAGVCDGGRVAVVAVDAGEDLAGRGLDLVDLDGAGGTVPVIASVGKQRLQDTGGQMNHSPLAVAARAVKLAKVLNGEAGDGDAGRVLVGDTKRLLNMLLTLRRHCAG